MAPIPVVDVFAGPGGLNEGFSSHGGGDVFSTVASIEMDAIACKTLRLRAALRHAQCDGSIPEIYFQFMKGDVTFEELIESPAFDVHWKHGEREVHQHELAEATRSTSDALIAEALGEAADGTRPWVLIGGPPCQAYSLAGRSRRKHDEDFADDHKHTLYREYLNIIERFRPHVFVMENVKGMLSSRHDGGAIFRKILDDLRKPADDLQYELRSFVVPVQDEEHAPGDFIIRSERFGVPQARHRVIILGVRGDLQAGPHEVLEEVDQVSVQEAIGDLPKIRSGLSPRPLDSFEAWAEAYVLGATLAKGAASRRPARRRLGTDVQAYLPKIEGELQSWLRRDAPDGWISHHASRYHMSSDLSRYAYLAAMALKGSRPRVYELPDQLIPKHSNARRLDAPFADRFRVQVGTSPSSTITSHIAKDGHYYIHPDPTQMRSLTVREAARLQTFPDNYHFMGNRTQQYHQVGNAVPPLLASKLAAIVKGILCGR